MNEQSLELPAETLKLLGSRFNVQEHNWEQRGHEIICNGNCTFNHRHGHSVGADIVLTGVKGDWKLVNIEEERKMRQRK